MSLSGVQTNIRKYNLFVLYESPDKKYDETSYILYFPKCVVLFLDHIGFKLTSESALSLKPENWARQSINTCITQGL